MGREIGNKPRGINIDARSFDWKRVSPTVARGGLKPPDYTIWSVKISH